MALHKTNTLTLRGEYHTTSFLNAKPGDKFLMVSTQFNVANTVIFKGLPSFSTPGWGFFNYAGDKKNRPVFTSFCGAGSFDVFFKLGKGQK